MSRVTSFVIPTTKLPSHEEVPVLGQGTWHMAEDPRGRKEELQALRLGLDLGMTLIDTAEMYGDGETEMLVGEAIAGRREEVFLVSKVLPHHATRDGTMSACEASLRRLATDYLDLYLLHWPGSIPLDETLEAFARLADADKIRYWGVSNFDFNGMVGVYNLPEGAGVATDQVLYNLAHRGIEYDLLPWCRKQRIPIMAYSPVGQGRLLDSLELRQIARRHQATPSQIALAWVLRQDRVIAIPKAGNARHVRENLGALDVRLTNDDLADLDRAFPSPTSAQPLAMI